MILGNTNLYQSRSSRPSLKVSNEDSSLFVESLDIIKENDRNLREILKSVHSKVAISEASDKDIVFLREFSIGDIIHNIIDFFIETIKTIFNRFKNLFLKFIMDDKTIAKYENKIKNIKGEFVLSIERYNFTCFDHDIPRIDLNSEFDQQYETLYTRLKSLNSIKSKNELIERMNVIEADVKSDINEQYYDQARARCLCKSYPYIHQDDYSTELFNTFRGGGDPLKSKINFTDTTIAYDQYMSYKKVLKDTEKLKNETINEAKKIEQKINSINIKDVNKSYIPYDTESEVVFRRILSAKSGQVSTVCNIFVMAFSAKLDAIKDSAKQNKQILYETIQYINSGANN